MARQRSLSKSSAELQKSLDWAFTEFFFLPSGTFYCTKVKNKRAPVVSCLYIVVLKECFRHYSVCSGQISDYLEKNLPELPLFFFTCRLNFHDIGLCEAEELISLSLTDLQGSSDLIWCLALLWFWEVMLPYSHPFPLHPAKTQYLVLAGYRELIPGWFLTLPLISKYVCFSHCWTHHWSHCQCKQPSGETAIAVSWVFY